jgi:hypothetical protein
MGVAERAQVATDSGPPPARGHPGKRDEPHLSFIIARIGSRYRQLQSLPAAKGYGGRRALRGSCAVYTRLRRESWLLSYVGWF